MPLKKIDFFKPILIQVDSGLNTPTLYRDWLIIEPANIAQFAAFSQ